MSKTEGATLLIQVVKIRFSSTCAISSFIFIIFGSVYIVELHVVNKK